MAVSHGLAVFCDDRAADLAGPPMPAGIAGATGLCAAGVITTGVGETVGEGVRASMLPGLMPKRIQPPAPCLKVSELRPVVSLGARWGNIRQRFSQLVSITANPALACTLVLRR
jgi:hypothetical protein